MLWLRKSMGSTQSKEWKKLSGSGEGAPLFEKFKRAKAGSRATSEGKFNFVAGHGINPPEINNAGVSTTLLNHMNVNRPPVKIHYVRNHQDESKGMMHSHMPGHEMKTWDQVSAHPRAREVIAPMALLGSKPEHHAIHVAPDGNPRFVHKGQVGLLQGDENGKPLNNKVDLSHVSPTERKSEAFIAGLKHALKLSPEHIDQALTEAGFDQESHGQLSKLIRSRQADLRKRALAGEFTKDPNHLADFAEKPIKSTVKDGDLEGLAARLNDSGFSPFKHIKSKQDEMKVVKRLRQLFHEGAHGQYWYPEGAKEILNVTKGNKEDARKLAALLAIYSPATEVFPNTENALRAYIHWKSGGTAKELRGGNTEENDRKARDLLYNNHWWGGIKTNSFYKNHMDEIDKILKHGDHLKQFKAGKDLPVTNDMHVARAILHDKEAFTPKEHRYVTQLFNRLARQAGMLPSEYQARVWTGMKARGLADADLARPEVNKALQEARNKKGAPLDKKEHSLIRRQVMKGFKGKGKPTEQHRLRAAASFKHGMKRIEGSAEIPFINPNHVAENLEPHEKQELSEQIAKVVHPGLAHHFGMPSGDVRHNIDPLGRSSVAINLPKKLQPKGAANAKQKEEVPTQAVQQGLFGADTQTEYKGKRVSQGMAPRNPEEIDPDAERLAAGYASGFADVLGHDRVQYHRPLVPKNNDDANAVNIEPGHPLAADEYTQIKQAIRKATKSEPHFVPTEQGGYFINTSKMPNGKFQTAVSKIIKDLYSGEENLFDHTGKQSDVKVSRLKAQGQVLQGGKNGEHHRRRIAAASRNDWTRTHSTLTRAVRRAIEQYHEKIGKEHRLPEAYGRGEEILKSRGTFFTRKLS